MKYGVLLFIIAMFFLSSSAKAQDNNNNVVVVSYFKCNNLEEVNKKLEQEGASILNKLINEGQLLDWGAMTHYWGDEWNYIIYYVAEDLGTFENAFGEYYARVTEAYPDGMEEWENLCTGHKDNIYQHVMGYQEEDGNSGSRQAQ